MNFTFKLDEISLDKIKGAIEFNTLKIEFYFAMEGGYKSYIYETEELLLDYTTEIKATASKKSNIIMDSDRIKPI